MRFLICVMLFGISAAAQPISRDNAVRIDEFYRLAAQIQDRLWKDWSKIPAPLLLVTSNREFLVRFPTPPKDFLPANGSEPGGVYSRPRKFDTHFLATFPAFGPPAVIVVGEPKHTEARTSTPWLITLMHEHFHQLQYAQPGYYKSLDGLGLSGGDTSGMWMLNYPFPYEQPELARDFSHLRDLLLQALNASDDEQLKKLGQTYLDERKNVFGRLAPNDSKYFNLQLWQEGIARYTQIKAAEAAADYRPTAEYAALPDFEPFSTLAVNARRETLAELKRADLTQWKRVFAYSFGAAEGLLLDRLNPGWQADYFKHPFSIEPLLKINGDSK